jgi:hypothetical protein
VPDNSWAVAPFPFDAPFVFTGQAHLSLRAIVWGNSNNNTNFTYPLDAWWNIGTTANNGPATGCQAATGTQAATHTVSGPFWGGNTTFNGNSFVVAGGLPALLVIGHSNTDWSGVPLPFDLTSLGAPNCFLRNNLLMTAPGITQAGANGTASIVVPIPADRTLAGGIFYSQFWFLDPGANNLGLFVSASRTNTIGHPVDVTRIYAAGNPNATSGALGRHFGMALGFN